MTKMLKITLNGETFLADMLWDKAPETCKLFESSCPVESRIFSAKICDAEVTYPVSGPIANYEHIENPVFHEPAGAVSWYGGWSSICIFFDVCEPFGTCNMFARICEADRERFAAACRNVWDNQGMCIKNEIVGIEAVGLKMMDINTLLALDLAEYTTALEALADQMMLEEPRDIDYMRRRKLDTGREFAVWNFTVGYCMNAADALSLLRAQANENANDGTADLATINNSAARLCDWFSGAFDVTGKMDDTTAILAHSRDLYAQVETHEQFAALTRATERYLVQLQFWVDRQIPWPAISDLVHGYRLRTESGETR